MIGAVKDRGHRVAGLIWYLYGPGKACEHTNPHLVSGWRHPAELEPPMRPGGGRDFRMLNDLLEQPVIALGDRARRDPVWHCVVRADPDDPELGDGAWMRIAGEVMHRTGLSRYGEEDDGVRWVAVHHGDNHIHIVATLARQDGRKARLDDDWKRIGEAMRAMEAEYGLVMLEPADGTADKRPTRAETEIAARTGQPEPARVTLRRHVQAAAAGARTEPEFFAALTRRGVTVRLRHSTHEPGEVTGYAVSLPGWDAAGGGPVWFGGGKLAPDLTLPRLRRRWPDPARRAHTRPGPAGGPEPGPHTGPQTGLGPRSRLHGNGMNDRAARTTLRREVARCAAAARTEPEFFGGLNAAGLMVRLRYSSTRPGQVAGYAVSLPGLGHHRDGQQVWYGGQTLDDRLGLPVLRRRWAAGRAGGPPVPDAFDGADAGDIYGHAATVATEAAQRMRTAPPDEAADIAWAAADVLTAAADAAGSPELRRAAGEFTRAARAPWGRIPPASAGGAGLRTAAYLLAASTPGGFGRKIARMALFTALGGLADSLAELRTSQQRLLQAAAARSAATGMAGTATAGDGAPAAAAGAWLPGPLTSVRPAAGRPARTGTRPPRRPPGPMPSRRRSR